MTPAAAEQLARSVAAGLSPTVTDEAVLRRVAVIVAAARARQRRELVAGFARLPGSVAS